MRKKITRAVAFGVALIIFFGGGYFAGFAIGQITPKSIEIENLNHLEKDKPDSVDFSVFWQAWDLLDREYLKHDEGNAQEKVYGAVRGLVQSLDDPYTQYFTPEDNKRFQEDVQGSFAGIGAELSIRKERLVVVAPLKDTPASRAGLKAGDIIVKINSTSTENLQIDEAVSMIRGLANSTVTLSIFREDWGKIKDIVLKREKINLPTLDSKIVGDNILHVRLYSFNGVAHQRLAEEIEKTLTTKPIGGLILDLRDNPGGYLEVAVNIANWFLPKGSVIVTEEGLEEKQVFKAEKEPPLEAMPVVILINEGSASASEILAGALQDNKRAKLVGGQSFGKGTVQELRTLKDGSAIKMTIAHWVLPSGKILEGNGLKPDYEVALPEDASPEKDTQLEKAIEVMKPQIKTLFKSS